MFFTAWQTWPLFRNMLPLGHRLWHQSLQP
jgi:hypothetical protein